MPDIVAGVIGIALVFIWIYCLYDVITTHDGARAQPAEDRLVRHRAAAPRSRVHLVAVLRSAPSPESTSSISTGSALEAPAPPIAEFEMSSLDHLHPVVREREELARLRMMQAQLQRRENELRQRGLGDSAES